MKGETNFDKQRIGELIVTITGCVIWISITAWGFIKNHQQCISVVEHSLLLFIVFVYGDSHQIKNLIKFRKSWTKN
jgi:hypothetical protein